MTPPTTAPARPAPPDRVPDGVTAVVLTHRRRRLASGWVRTLLDTEGLDPARVVVVVNGDGGLDSPALEAAVRMVRLPANLGPAGGFRAGLETAFADPATTDAYLCEDDLGLFDLPLPRLAELCRRAERAGPRLGAVVAYGRRFVGRGAHTANWVPTEGPWPDLSPVDVAPWGATLVRRAVVEAGVLPDPSWFFGLEDFDFFCRVREAGFAVVVDGRSARAVAGQQTSTGRAAALGSDRPTDAAEPWRAYYHARNSVTLARRHGRPSWHVWHAAYAARQWQLAPDRATRSALVRGLADGVAGRRGPHPGYGRTAGERPASGDGLDDGLDDGTPDGGA